MRQTKCNGFLHELGLSLGLCHLCQTVGTKRILRTLRALLRALCVLDRGRHTRLRKRDRCHIRCKTGDADVVVAFEMKLQISNFERVSAAVLCETTAEIGDRVDELVSDVQQQIFDFGLDLHVRVDAED